MFKRKKAADEQVDVDAQIDDDDAQAGSRPRRRRPRQADRRGGARRFAGRCRLPLGSRVGAAGPYDASSVPTGGVSRVDLGSIQVAGFTEMQLHFETDPAQSRFVSVVAAFRDGALRLQPLAAPRSGGLWDEMREQITSSIAEAGGDVAEVEGTFGTELHGVVPATTPDGEQVRQPIRLVAYEGPRWLLHGVFMGSAPIDDGMGELFEDVFRQTVVVRGEQPMAPGEVLPISLPPEAQAQQQAAAEQAAAQQQGGDAGGGVVGGDGQQTRCNRPELGRGGAPFHATFNPSRPTGPRRRLPAGRTTSDRSVARPDPPLSTCCAAPAPPTARRRPAGAPGRRAMPAPPSAV